MTVWPLLAGVTGAAFFPSKDHRLWLERRWGEDIDENFVLHVGMNPSYADANGDDLTVRKDQEFTRRIGFSRMVKMNVGTFISTDPKGLSAPDVIVSHPYNTAMILECALRARRVIVATGDPPKPLIDVARNLLRGMTAAGFRMECFGLTKGGWPKHSSRLGYASKLALFEMK